MFFHILATFAEFEADPIYCPLTKTGSPGERPALAATSLLIAKLSGPSGPNEPDPAFV
jgi:hypothetical protein